MSVLCGHCKDHHDSIAQVRECSQATGALKTMAASVVTADQYKPMALQTPKVPDSRYALLDLSTAQLRPDTWRFYQVRSGKGKWDGVQFLDQLIGAPGDYRKAAIKGAYKSKILSMIAKDPKASAVAFAKQSGRCAVCLSPLSDPESIARSMGPVCAKRF